ncbi:MAG TPA: GNAT family N-acetyltransferase [Anaerolineae bacterium]|nr:GNAT family N-acetyltransferase [Anaerolineae bacterium]
MSNAYPPETVTLRDGTAVRLRAIQPDDAPRLQALHARLSTESIFLRFLDQRTALPDRDAQQLANVDYRTRMAIVAALAEEPEQLIGVARYAAIDSAQLDTAEAAIVVQDDYQERGLGTILVDRLVGYARGQGVHAFLATVHYSNAEIMRFIQRSGLTAQKKLEAGVWEIKINLDAAPDRA